jgi:hypothetical protein
MTQSIRDTIKKRGRPATGKGEATMVRLQPDLAGRVDGWATSQPDAPTRPEAIRRLVELGLAAIPKKHK